MHRVSLNLKITLLVEENRFLDSGGPVSAIPQTGKQVYFWFCALLFIFAKFQQAGLSAFHSCSCVHMYRNRRSILFNSSLPG